MPAVPTSTFITMCRYLSSWQLSCLCSSLPGPHHGAVNEHPDSPPARQPAGQPAGQPVRHWWSPTYSQAGRQGSGSMKCNADSVTSHPPLHRSAAVGSISGQQWLLWHCCLMMTVRLRRSPALAAAAAAHHTPHTTAAKQTCQQQYVCSTAVSPLLLHAAAWRITMSIVHDNDSPIRNRRA